MWGTDLLNHYRHVRVPPMTCLRRAVSWFHLHGVRHSSACFVEGHWMHNQSILGVAALCLGAQYCHVGNSSVGPLDIYAMGMWTGVKSSSYFFERLTIITSFVFFVEICDGVYSCLGKTLSFRTSCGNISSDNQEHFYFDCHSRMPFDV